MVIIVALILGLGIMLMFIGLATSGRGSGISARLERYTASKPQAATTTVQAGVDLPLRAIREQVASAVDLIVQQSRLKDGTRRIVNITEVQGMEGDVIVMQDVFIFEQTGVVEGKIQGRLRPTGIRPKFVEKFEVMGINLPPGLFGFTY